MYFDKPLHKTSEENIFHLAPIPVYCKQFEDDDFQDAVFRLGLKHLSPEQKQMGQELPNQYDENRQKWYELPSDFKETWVEEDEDIPIGSRFYTPPNDFLEIDNPLVTNINNRITEGFSILAESINKPIYESKITESWLQYYEPYSGRGHNAHNHCRWQRGEEKPLMFSGGYYLADGEPIKDHPYSGAFAFHIRGQLHFIRPKKGMLILWPYDIVHSVKPFYGKTQRAVINFNIQSVG
tara:strand:+ start:2346 stop:3059 length:714 start_codon:yes stop_codon:yes gene_type:complete